MKKLMIAAAALLLSAPLFAQEKNFIDQPYLEVNGRAEMEVAPDEIYEDQQFLLLRSVAVFDFFVFNADSRAEGVGAAP